ncbi:cytochrome P450 [soil metagenome]
MTGEAIKRLFTGDPRKRWHGNDATRPLIGERSILLLEPDEHLARRKLLLPSFHGERIAGYGDLTQRLVDGEVSRWRVGEEVAVLPKAQDLTIEVILQAVLGVSDRTERDRFRKLIDDVLFYPMGSRRSARTARRHRIARGRLREPAAVLAALPTPAVLTYFPELWRRKIWNFGTLRWWRHRGRLLELLDQHVASVRSDPLMAQRTDILATLASARDEDGEALDPADLRDDLLALIGAGHETTAAAIAWGAVFLAHSPDVQQWAAERVGEGDDAALDALVKEVLRIRPPLPIAAGRVLDEPFTVGDHVVPPGTTIMVDAWGIHHDPDLYPEPERFRPERFLEREPEAYGWIPFGGGAHRCIGSALAMLEIKIALSEILRRVSLKPCERTPAPATRRAVTLVPYGGGRVRVSASAPTGTEFSSARFPPFRRGR